MKVYKSVTFTVELLSRVEDFMKSNDVQENEAIINLISDGLEHNNNGCKKKGSK